MGVGMLITSCSCGRHVSFFQILWGLELFGGSVVAELRSPESAVAQAEVHKSGCCVICQKQLGKQSCAIRVAQSWNLRTRSCAILGVAQAKLHKPSCAILAAQSDQRVAQSWELRNLSKAVAQAELRNPTVINSRSCAIRVAQSCKWRKRGCAILGVAQY